MILALLWGWRASRVPAESSRSDIPSPGAVQPDREAPTQGARVPGSELPSPDVRTEGRRERAARAAERRDLRAQVRATSSGAAGADAADGIQAPEQLAPGECLLWFRGRTRRHTATTWWCRAPHTPDVTDAAIVEAFRGALRPEIARGELRATVQTGTDAKMLRTPQGTARVTWRHRPGGLVHLTIFQRAGRDLRFLRAAGFSV